MDDEKLIRDPTIARSARNELLGRIVHPEKGCRERAGLCADCRQMRLITSDRDSTFYMCQRSAWDKNFAKYPRLPVVRCLGYDKNSPVET